MNSARIVHGSTSGMMPEHARDSRARAWMYLFSVYEAKKKATPASGPDDGTKVRKDSADAPSLPH